MPEDIRKPLRKILPDLIKAKRDNLNEADTCMRICEVIGQVLGYDPLQDVNREVQIKEGLADFVVKVDGRPKFIVEAKAAGVVLRSRHVGQAERYAAEGNIPWVVVTNGLCWHLYHLTFEEGIDYETVFTIDLEANDFAQACDRLSLLHKKSVRKDEHEEFWQRQAALGPASVARALFAEDLLGRMRREIRRREGVLIDQEDLGRAIHNMFSVEVREKIGPFKIFRKRKRKPAPSDAPSLVKKITNALIPCILFVLVGALHASAQIRTVDQVCYQKWPNSYEMQAYCVKQETEAYRRMGSRKYFVEKRIMEHCQSRWSESWVMLEYCVNQEEQARERLRWSR